MEQRILRPREVAAMTSLSRSTLYDLVKVGQFPSSVRIGRRRIGWDRREVEAWIEARLGARDRQSGMTADNRTLQEPTSVAAPDADTPRTAARDRSHMQEQQQQHAAARRAATAGRLAGEGVTRG